MHNNPVPALLPVKIILNSPRKDKPAAIPEIKKRSTKASGYINENSTQIGGILPKIDDDKADGTYILFWHFAQEIAKKERILTQQMSTL